MLYSMCGTKVSFLFSIFYNVLEKKSTIRTIPISDPVVLDAFSSKPRDISWFFFMYTRGFP